MGGAGEEGGFGGFPRRRLRVGSAAAWRVMGSSL